MFYALPIIILLYLMFQSSTKDILFAEKEKIGDEVQRPLMKMLSLVATIDDGAIAEEKKKQMKEQMDKYRASEAKYTDDLLFGSEELKKRKRESITFSEMDKNWQNLLTQNNQAKRDELIAQIRLAITHIGDTSNLILDPDLDSYYLMDVTLLAYPQMLDRLYQLRKLHKKDNEIISASVVNEFLKQADMDRILASFDTVKNEDGNFYGTNLLIQNEIGNSNDELKRMVEDYRANLSKSWKENTVDVASLNAQNSKIIDMASAGFEKSVLALDQLLEARVTKVKHDRFVSMMIGISAVVIALLVSIFTAFNFKEGTKKIIFALEKLTKTTKENQDTSNSLSSASVELSSSSSEQAAALQESVSTLEEINAMVGKSLDHATETEKMSSIGRSKVQVGKNAVGKMDAAIKDMNQTNQQILTEIVSNNEEMSKISILISEIEKKTSVINDIVFQTKLLSFNASVEAARAGEQGKGFAVVAEEVGNLAEMSGRAAKEISDMLKESKRQVEEIASKTQERVTSLGEEIKHRIEISNQVSSECSSTLDELIADVERINQMMAEVTVAVREQSAGIAQITIALQQIDSGVHSNVEMSENTSVFAEKLNHQVTELAQIVSQIELEVKGSTTV